MPQLNLPRSRNPFAMFAQAPVGVSFDAQDTDEQIILLLRAHIVTLVPPILITIFLLVLPFFIGALLRLIGIDLGATLSALQIFLISVFYYLFVFGFAFFRFLLWFFNVYLLTTERIIDFDFVGILQRQVSYAKLTEIEDVTPKTLGFFGTFFNFGNVFIQTAGEKNEFLFEKVARPDDVAEAIMKQARLEGLKPPGAGE